MVREKKENKMTSLQSDESTTTQTQLTPNELLLSMFQESIGEERPPDLDAAYQSQNEYNFTKEEQELIGDEYGDTLETMEDQYILINDSDSESPQSPQVHSPTLSDELKPLFHWRSHPGGQIGIRKPRPSKLDDTNLSLAKLNPMLAEALASIKDKNGTPCRGFNMNSSQLSFNDVAFSSENVPMPTRMSGPVTLETPLPTSSVPSYTISEMYGMKMMRQQTCDEMSIDSSSSNHIVSFNGQTTEVPEEILCHLCNFPMKICIRKSKYKGEIREYPAYRCLRKGCQTFRAIRKVIEPEPATRKRKISSQSMDIGFLDDIAKSIVTPPPQPLQGTIIYVPTVLTSTQIEKMLQAACEIVGGDENVIPHLSHCSLNSQQIEQQCQSTFGPEFFSHLILSGMMPSTPYFSPSPSVSSSLSFSDELPPSHSNEQTEVTMENLVFDPPNLTLLQ